MCRQAKVMAEFESYAKKKKKKTVISVDLSGFLLPTLRESI